MKKRIGTLYLTSKYFLDEANSTMGQPMLSAEIMQNRRNVTSRLTLAGQGRIADVLHRFKERGMDVELKWSKNAGCTMCPCSPGFKISMEVEKYSYRKIDVWVGDDGTSSFREN